jgi:hypothetical protein
MTVETVTSLDEAKVLGYFETIKSVFLLKLILLTSVTKTNANGKRTIDMSRLGGPIDAVKAVVDDPIFYQALARGNDELVANFQEDIMTSLFSASWIVFEQITKDLTRADYATRADELNLCYQNGRFRFDAREKKDIELFYYMRNAIQHYNGAYYAYKDIDHRYAGVDFKSQGHHGEKLDMNIALTWRIANDLERYTLKAWSNSKTFASKKQV